MARRNQGQQIAESFIWIWRVKDGKHPIKIRVTFQRKRKYYPVLMLQDDRSQGKTGKVQLYLSEREYNAIKDAPLKGLRSRNREIRLTIDSELARVTETIEGITNYGKRPFTWHEFDKQYLGADTASGFLHFFVAHLERMEKKGQAGNVRTYQSALSAYSQFIGNPVKRNQITGKYEFAKGKDIDPASINVRHLEAFEEWLKREPKKGEKWKPKRDNSVSIYMRCLRAIYNEMAMDDEHLKGSTPFSSNGGRDKKYLIPVGSGQKGATLDAETIKSFIKGKISGEENRDNPMFRAKLIFLFSFFAQGITPVDIAHLRYSNITNGVIRFERRKTIRTRTEAKIIEVSVTNELAEIIAAIGNTKKDSKEYIFDVFNASRKYTTKQQDDTVRQFVKTTNKWLKRYSKLNGIQEFSTYSARHTFSNFAKDKVSVAQISEWLGHSRITTTQAYIGRFNKEKSDQALNEVFSVVR